MKLPKNYVPGVGEVKATCYGGFGQKMLESMGWSKGQGLGREKRGMREALEVKEKKDTLGVGAAGGWDWNLKFWEEAYNSSVKKLEHDTSSSSSSDTDVERKASAASSASSSSGSDSDSDSDSGPTAHHGRRAAPAMHRDGVAARSATADELKIAAALSKDPWGRWGGRAGKMARIAAQEAADAAKAAALAKPEVGGSKLRTKRERETEREKEAEEERAREAAAKAKRIVITLKVKEDPSIKKAAFKPTPKAGWWGANYWISAGALESMEEAGEHVAKERKTFNEDDQANLYMQVHNNARQGHRGLGKSTTVNVAGGKWEGTKRVFNDDEEGEVAAAGPASSDPDINAAEPAGTSSKLDGKKASKAGKREKYKETAGAAEAGTEDADTDAPNKKKKIKKVAAAVDEEPAQLPSDAGAAARRVKDVKWLKMAKMLLKQAPKRRLKLNKLCKQLLLEAHTKHGSRAGEEGSWSKELISKIMKKKAKKSKVVIGEDDYVSLP